MKVLTAAQHLHNTDTLAFVSRTKVFYWRFTGLDHLHCDIEACLGIFPISSSRSACMPALVSTQLPNICTDDILCCNAPCLSESIIVLLQAGVPAHHI